MRRKKIVSAYKSHMWVPNCQNLVKLYNKKGHFESKRCKHFGNPPNQARNAKTMTVFKFTQG